jgi:hypothetical protein
MIRVLELKRFYFTSESTIGELYLDGSFECYTLEDCVRAPGVKIPGKTAIGAGSFDVVIDMSARFKRRMPHVLDVPMFEGIRIHAGNTAADTEGCILVAVNRLVDRVTQSVIAYDRLFPKLDAALDAGDSVRLVITDRQPKTVGVAA